MKESGPILFLINSFGIGGAERVFIDDLLALRRQNVPVHAAALFSKGSLGTEIEAAGAELHELHFRSAFDRNGIRELLLLVRKLHCTTVFSTLNEANAAARIGKVLGGRYRLITREANMADMKSLKYKAIDMLFGWSSEKIVAVSKAVGESLCAYAPWLRSRVVVLYNGTATDMPFRVRTPHEHLRLMTVGSLTEKKDHAILIRAMAALPEKWRLTIVGTGSLREELEKLARDLGTANRIRFAGKMPHQEVLAALQEHDIFVLPSKREGCPNVVSEAQAAGLGVVAFAIPGMSEFVSDASGVLVQERTPEALAAGIRAAATAIAALGEAGYKEVRVSRSREAHMRALESLLQ